MDLDEPTKNKRSLGKLRTAEKTKEKSPDITGTLRLQRHTVTEILKQFEVSNFDEVECNIAGWVNCDHEGEYLIVETSPKFLRREWRPGEKNRLGFIFGSQEEHN